MFGRSVFPLVLLTLGLIVILDECESRYLPTRSNTDRIEKLRELIKELLENELEKEEINDMPRWHPDTKLFYKREATPPR